MCEVCSHGLLHSEICGSMCTYHSPQLIAVNYVLRRLPMPRHSPCALFSFTICFMFWVLLIVNQILLVVFYPIKFYSIVLTRSILICITFFLFCFQVAFTLKVNFSNYFHNCSNPSLIFWWAQMDSNHRPHAYQACALTTWAMRPLWWRWGGSNSWPPACKAGALPAELHPRFLTAPSKLNNASLSLADRSMTFVITP